MADFNKRGPFDCDSECGEGGEGGERGERGRRGKRGARGHDGRDGRNGHDGATGPTGPSSSLPFEPGPPLGLGPTIPGTFFPPYPEEDVYVVIFARPAPAGSDETGDGSFDRPYRTFQRAVRDVPYFVMPGYHYIIELTGLGEETLPDGYNLPAWISGNGNGNGFAVTIDADHELALGPVDSILAAGVMNEDPDTGMFSIDDPSKMYETDALVGLFVYGTSAENPDETGLVGVVHANTATEVFVTSNEGADVTFPFSIRRCSATLRGASVGAFSGMLTCCFPHSLAIDGIAIIPTDPEDTGWCQQGGHVWFFGCHLVRPRLNSGVRFHGLEQCNIVNSDISGEMYVKSSRLSGDGCTWGRSANQGLSLFRGTTLDGCGSIICFDTSSVDGEPFGGQMNISNVLIKNSIGDAIFWPGGNVSLKFVKIEDTVAGPFTPGNALTLQGGLFAKLVHVTGSGNAGVGIRVINGAQVEIAEGTTVTGTGPNTDQHVGTLPPGDYPPGLFNIVDVYTGVNPYIVGTGARLFRSS